MRSRLPLVVATLLWLALGSALTVSAWALARMHAQVIYLTEPALKTKDGVTLTRRDLIDALILERFQSPPASPKAPEPHADTPAPASRPTP